MTDFNRYSIPLGWVRVRLHDVVRPIRPKVRPADFPSLRFIGMEHIEAHTSRLLATVEASRMKSSAVYFQPGDVLYGRLRPYLNKVHRAEFAGLCSAEFIVLTPYEGIDATFIKYLLNSWGFVSFASGLNAGIDRPRVDFEGIADYEFAIPAFPEQQRIVEKLDSLLSKLEAATGGLQQAAANLERYRTSVLKAAVEGRLVPTEAELARKEGRDFEPASLLLDRILAERRRRWGKSELARMKLVGRPPKDGGWKSRYKDPAPDARGLSELPDGWCWATLDQLLFAIEAGKNVRCTERPPNEDEIGVVKISAVTWGNYNEEESKTYPPNAQVNPIHLIREGDLLFSRANTIELVGACVIARNVRKKLTLSDKILRLRAVQGLEEWILWCLRSQNGRKQIEAMATGNQQSMRNIGQDRIRRIGIPLPPPRELRKILESLSEKTSDIDQWHSAASASQQRIVRLRQSILKWAFEGKLVDQDPNGAPASLLLERIRAERTAQAHPRKLACPP